MICDMRVTLICKACSNQWRNKQAELQHNRNTALHPNHPNNPKLPLILLPILSVGINPVQLLPHLWQSPVFFPLTCFLPFLHLFSLSISFHSPGYLNLFHSPSTIFSNLSTTQITHPQNLLEFFLVRMVRSNYISHLFLFHWTFLSYS